MAIGLDTDTEYARRSSIPSGGAGTLSDGGFTNTFTGVWVYRPSATATYALTASGSIIHLQSGAREVALGFDSAGSNLSDLSLYIIFNSGGGAGTPYFFPAHAGDDFLDEWVYYFIFDNATDGQTAGYIRLADLNTAVIATRANDNAGSQYANTLTFGNNSSGNAVVLGHYAFGRARYASGITLDDVKDWAASDAAAAGDWGFWPKADNTDTGDDSGNGRSLTFNGTLTSESDPVLAPPASIDAPLGYFDPELVPPAWHTVTQLPIGWFEAQFVEPVAGGPTVITVTARSFEAAAPRGARTIRVQRAALSTDVPAPRTDRAVRATRGSASSEGATPRASAAPLAAGIITVTARSSEGPSGRSARSVVLTRTTRASEPSRGSSVRAVTVTRGSASGQPSRARAVFAYVFQRQARADAAPLSRSARSVTTTRSARSAEGASPRAQAAPLLPGIVVVTARSFEGAAPRGARSIITIRSASASEAPRVTGARQLRATRAAASREAPQAFSSRTLRMTRAGAAWEAAGQVVARLLRALRTARSSEAPRSTTDARFQPPTTRGRILSLTATAVTTATVTDRRVSSAAVDARAASTTVAATAASTTLRERAATAEVSDT